MNSRTADILKVMGLTSLAMVAFAGNSILCRLALRTSSIDPVSFTAIRLLSGSVLLVAVIAMRSNFSIGGSWLASLYLFGYAAGFSIAYLYVPASVGALLLFGAVQVTMILAGFLRGERLSGRQWVGFIFAFAGLVLLLLPGLGTPSVVGSILMVLAGVCWGLYSLKGTKSGDATKATAGNFLRAAVLSLVLSAFFLSSVRVSTDGFLLAVASGTITSGMGYAIWFVVVKRLKSFEAAVIQLSVPVLTALLGLTFLGEDFSLTFLIPGGVVLGGILVVLVGKRQLEKKD